MLEVVRRARFLDPKLFTAFAAAAELENFTRAAQVARMTQSGVSQHVAKLEEQVGRPLFRRAGNKVGLTHAGKALLKYLRGQVADLDAFFDVLEAEEATLSGVVTYAMPPSCLFSDHFEQLLAKRVKQPRLRLKVTLASSAEVLDLVLQSGVDFGFVTSRPESPSIRFGSFCTEEYLLVTSSAEQAATMKVGDLFEHAVIKYPGADVYYDTWIRHFLPNESRDGRSLSFAGEINSLDGALTMAQSGLGVAVFPRHCVQKQLDQGRLHAVEIGSVRPLLNTIYVARHADVRLPRRVTQVIDWLYDIVERK